MSLAQRRAISEAKTRPLRDRVNEKIRRGKPTECWEWTGSVDSSGYGQVRVGSRLRPQERTEALVHRLIWEWAHGAPGKLFVLHRCDNRRCCNLKHLFLGTNLDNMIDMALKGRGRPGKGKNLSMQEIVDLRQMREDGFEQSVIAERFGVSQTTVSRITNRKTRRYI